MSMELATRRMFYVVWIVLGSIFLGVGILSYHAYLKPAPVKYLNLPWAIADPVTEKPLRVKDHGMAKIHPGDSIPLYVERELTEGTMRSYDVTREFVCQGRTPQFFESRLAPIRQGEPYFISKLNRAPIDAVPGTICKIRGIGEIDEGLQHYSLPWESEEFEIIR